MGACVRAFLQICVRACVLADEVVRGSKTWIKLVLCPVSSPFAHAATLSLRYAHIAPDLVMVQRTPLRYFRPVPDSKPREKNSPARKSKRPGGVQELCQRNPVLILRPVGGRSPCRLLMGSNVQRQLRVLEGDGRCALVVLLLPQWP